MQHVLFLESAGRLGVEDGCLSFTSSEETATISLHPEDILAVVAESVQCIITIPALLLCMENTIPVVLCNEKHQPEVYCLDYFRHTELLERLSRQIGWSYEAKKQAWLYIIQRKLLHQQMLVQHVTPKASAVACIQGYRESLVGQELTEIQINTAESISARVYFAALFGEGFKRFDSDSTNHALNYGYAVLRAQIMTALTVKGLHPTLGIWHHSIRNRFNLADDILEIMRPLVDHVVWQFQLGTTSLGKDHKQQLLSLLYATVDWNENTCALRTAIHYQIDALSSFLDQRSAVLPLISLRGLYGPD